MFCPKCGTKNPEAGKFCRSCGADLSVVSSALTGDRREIVDVMFGDDKRSRRLRAQTDPDEAWSAGIRQSISGVGFLIISMVLFYTNVAGGSSWWWAMLFPGFSMLASGIASIVRARRLERRQAVGFSSGNQPVIGGSASGGVLPPAHTEFARPDSAYRTGDLVPPSVVENTTRHLSIDNEGETMTLPKK